MPRAMAAIKHFSTASSAFQRIGFIGLGNMGSHMASNLMKGGYQLVVQDINNVVVKAFEENGAIAAKSPLEVAELTDAVITMLPSAESVSDVYLGKKGLLSKKNDVRPFLLIDSSTVDPKTCRDIARFSKQCSLMQNSRHLEDFDHPIVLDSPVSGGVLGAQAGTLTFMVGGIEKGCKAAKPLLDCMGKNILYCGGSGNGAKMETAQFILKPFQPEKKGPRFGIITAAKICNNLALAVSMAGISEALSLGQKLGISAGTLSKIFNTSSARCWSSDSYNPVPGVMDGVPASRNYSGGFSCQLMKKDIGLAIAAADTKQAFTPLAQQVFKMYSQLCETVGSQKDFSSIFKFVYEGFSEEGSPDHATSFNKD